MAIKESQLPNSNQWEIKATGADIPKLAGMLTETANEGNRERISDPQGNQTVVPKDQIDQYRAQGYGRATSSIRMVMPEMPWQKKQMAPGKHRFRYNKLTKCMEEV